MSIFSYGAQNMLSICVTVQKRVNLREHAAEESRQDSGTIGSMCWFEK